MAVIRTRDDLKGWILRKLGHPIVDQEITEDQLEDAIDDAIDEYIEASGIGSTNRSLLLYDVTSSDIILPDNVKAVVGTFNSSAGDFSSDPTIWNSICNRSIRVGSGGYMFNMVTRTIFNSYYGMFNNKGYLFEMTLDKKLHITPQPKIGDKLAIDVIIELDPNDPSFVKHNWIKKYALAVCKYQWGFTMLKYGNVQLASGVSIDYSTIMEEGKSEMETLIEELESKYKFPSMFVVG